jgi:peptide/nickel transport system substrate-binding protein
VRRALALAYPYRAVLRSKGKVLGVTSRFATSVMTPGTPGRQPYDPIPGHAVGTTEAGRARALLRRAGALGYPIRFPYAADSPTSIAVKSVMVSAFRRAGFEPQPIRSTSQRIGPDFFNPGADVNLRIAGWCSDWPSARQWIPQIFGSATGATGSSRGVDGRNNYEFLSNPAIGARISRVERLPLKRQPAAWSSLERWIQTTYLAVIPTTYNMEAMAHGAKVRGMYFDPVYSMPTFQDVWLK